MNDLFFELIRVALGNADRLSHKLKPKEWQMLYDMAKKQSLVGICFAGVHRLVNSEKGGLLWHARNALSDLVGNGSQNTTTE